MTENNLDTDEMIYLFRQALCHADAKGRLPIHVALENPHQLTLECIQDFIHLAPPRIWCTAEHVHGRYPLHVLSASCTPQPGHSALLLSLVRVVYRAYPQAARLPDSQGRYPLELALACGASDEIVLFLLNSCGEGVHGPWAKLFHSAALQGASVPVLFALLQKQPETLDHVFYPTKSSSS